jgi:fucose 4-O-acetylase-like acetyltransferase
MIREFDTDRCDPATGTAAGADLRSEFRSTDRVTTTDTASRTANGRSISDLFKDLRDESSRLVRQEVALAKTELSEKAAVFGRNAGYMGVGSALAHAALILLLFGLAAALYHLFVEMDMSNMLAGWLAPLIVGGITAAIGYALIQKAINAFKNESLVPEKTVDSLKENQQWLSRKATA